MLQRAATPLQQRRRQSPWPLSLTDVALIVCTPSLVVSSDLTRMPLPTISQVKVLVLGLEESNCSNLQAL